MRKFNHLICSLIILLTFLSPTKVQSQVYGNFIGIGLEGIGGNALEFVDVLKTSRGFEKVNSTDPVNVDVNGWPTGDFKVVLFDKRPCCPWIGSVDDPHSKIPSDVTGTYRIIFKGKADISRGSGTTLNLQNQVYDEPTNTTTADLVVTSDNLLQIPVFYNTQRTGSSPTNTGITGLKVLRPGYHNRPEDLFTREFINAVSHFPVLRFMDFLSTNNTNVDFPQQISWSDRVSPGDPMLNKRGVPWEYVVTLANITGKDIWINIPIDADEEYIQQLAQLMKNSLTNQDLKIYLELSNEVWNPGFTQQQYNKQAAIAEVNAGGSNLNMQTTQCDPNDENLWRGRRYVRELKKIADIFIETFSPGSRTAFGSKIRPVFCWQIGGWVPYYSCILEWFEAIYGSGSAKDNFYGIAGASYVNANGAASNASPEKIIEVMMDNSDAALGSKRDSPDAWTTGSGEIGLAQIADLFGLKVMQYETGLDNGGGDPTNIANRIQANRSAGMKELLIHDLKDNWFDLADISGNLVMYFTLSSGYTRYGCWGATEDLLDMHTPKLKALYTLMGIDEALKGPDYPVNVISERQNNSDVKVHWEAPQDFQHIMHYKIIDDSGPLATVKSDEPLEVVLHNYSKAGLSKIQVIALDAFNNISGSNYVTGFHEVIRRHGLEIYPNPAKKWLKICWGSAPLHDMNISIFSMNGQNVLNQKLVTHGEEVTALDIGQLHRGLYMIKMSTSKWCDTIKLYKE